MHACEMLYMTIEVWKIPKHIFLVGNRNYCGVEEACYQLEKSSQMMWYIMQIFKENVGYSQVVVGGAG